MFCCFGQPPLLLHTPRLLETLEYEDNRDTKIFYCQSFFDSIDTVVQCTAGHSTVLLFLWCYHIC